MSNPGPKSTLRFQFVVLGGAMLVCGLILAVLGFIGTGTFLGVVGLVAGLCGTAFIAMGLTRRDDR